MAEDEKESSSDEKEPSFVEKVLSRTEKPKKGGTKTVVSARTVAELCEKKKLKSWQKAGLLVFKQWSDETKVTEKEFTDGLEEFYNKPLGG